MARHLPFQGHNFEKSRHLLVLLLVCAIIFLGGVVLPQQSHSQESGQPTSKKGWISIDITALQEHLLSLTEDEQLEQLRDWSLLAALQEQGLTEEHLVQTLYDFLPLRVDYLTPLGNPRIGQGRWIALDQEAMLALVPESFSNRALTLGRLADEYYMLYGTSPKAIHVVEYRAKVDTFTIEIRQAEIIKDNRLFEASNGYIKRTIETLPELEQFLNTTGDLTAVHFEQGELVLAGRRLLPEAPPLLDLEDLATIYQAQGSVGEEIKARLSVKLPELYENRLDDFAEEVLADPDRPSDLQNREIIREFAKEVFPYEKFRDSLLTEIIEMNPPGLGFSLDPKPNLKTLAADLEAAANGDENFYDEYLQVQVARSKADINLALEGKPFKDIFSQSPTSQALQNSELHENDLRTLIGLPMQGEKTTSPSLSAQTEVTDLSVEETGSKGKESSSSSSEFDKLLARREANDLTQTQKEVAGKHAVRLGQLSRLARNGDDTALLEFQRYLTNQKGDLSIQRGERGDIVADAQEMLFSLELLEEPSDGIFGKKTQTAVRQFQAKVGLQQTGKIDYDTWNLLLTNNPEKRREFLLLNGLLSDIGEKNKYQCARYDGNLQGTRVGMTLYYTDLMMKLWLLNYQQTVPLITGFTPMPKMVVSPVYEESIDKYPATRVWLGVLEQGYEFHNKGTSLTFGPIATRIYNAGSDPLFPSKEVEANYPAERFSSWWNRHYATVADYEPQYHRLNQIMKWSLVINWLASKNVPVLESLKGVKVNRNHRFPTWYEKHAKLLVNVLIPFLPDGTEPTECLELLQSKFFTWFGRTKWVSGGVTLGSSKDIATKRLRFPEESNVNMLARRSGLHFGESVQSGRHLDLKFADGRLYNVRVPQRTISVSKGPRARFEGRTVQGDNISLNRQIRAVERKIEVIDRIGEHSLGMLAIVKQETGGLRLEFEPGGIIKTVDFAKKVAQEGESGVFSSGSKTLDLEVVAIPERNALLVKPDQESEWKLVTNKFESSEDPLLRVANQRLFREEREQVVLLSSESYKRLIVDHPWQVLSTQFQHGKQVGYGIASTLPSDAVSVTLRLGKESIPGHLNRTGFHIRASQPETGQLKALKQAEIEIIASAQPADVLAGIRRLETGELMYLEKEAPLSDSLQNLIDQTLPPSGNGIKGLDIYKTNSEGIRLTDDGILLIAKDAPLEEWQLTREIANQIHTDPSLRSVYAQIGQISSHDLSVLRQAPKALRTTYADFRSIQHVPADFALADLRLSNDIDSVLFRTGNQSPTLSKVSALSGQDIKGVADTLQKFYDDPRSIEFGVEEFTQATEPYFRFLNQVAEMSNAKTIVVAEHPGINSQMIWNLHGGRKDVRFLHDQPNIQKSLENALKEISPQLEGTVVMATASLTEPLDEDESSELPSVTQLSQEIASFAPEIVESLTWEDFRWIMEDKWATQITLIARVKDQGVLFSDQWVSFEDLADYLEFSGKPEKETIHVVSNKGEALGEVFINTGLFRRVVMSTYQLGSLNSFKRVVSNVKQFFEIFARPITNVDATAYKILLESLDSQELRRSLELATETTDKGLNINLEELPPEAREKVREQFQRIPPTPDNASLDAVIEKVGRDRIQQAQERAGMVPSSEKRAMEAELLKSIPKVKIKFKIYNKMAPEPKVA